MFDFTKESVCNIATNLLRLAEKKPNGPFDIQFQSNETRNQTVIKVKCQLSNVSPKGD